MFPAHLFWSNPRSYLMKVDGSSWREGNSGLAALLGSRVVPGARWAEVLGLDDWTQAEAWLAGPGREGEPLMSRGQVDGRVRWWRPECGSRPAPWRSGGVSRMSALK